MVTHIVMPVRDRLSLTASICEQLRHEDFHRCWVFNNGSYDGTAEFLHSLAKKDRRFVSIEAEELGVYAMWGAGVHLAQRGGHPVNVAIINNDLEITPGTMDALSQTLRSDPSIWITYPDYDQPAATEEAKVEGLRYTSGTYRHGGMSGFIFMLRGESITWTPLVDERFVWYYGDDDLAFTIEAQGGRQARVLGVGVTHINGGTSAVHPEVLAHVPNDAQAFAEKWPGR